MTVYHVCIVSVVCVPTLTVEHTLLRSNEWVGVDNKLERMWKEAVVAYVQTMCWNLSAVKKMNDEKPRMVCRPRFEPFVSAWANLFGVCAFGCFRREHSLTFLVRTHVYVANTCLLHKPAKNINFEVAFSFPHGYVPSWEVLFWSTFWYRLCLYCGVILQYCIVAPPVHVL
jgi:hypothetical protein